MKRQVSDVEISVINNEVLVLDNKAFAFKELDVNVVYKIQFYLDVRSLLSLKQTCRYMDANTDDFAKNLYSRAKQEEALLRVHTHLERLGILPKLQAFLARYNACVAGGFLLMHILGEMWEAHDLDIFLPLLSKEEQAEMAESIFHYFGIQIDLVSSAQVVLEQVEYMRDMKRNGSFVCTSNLICSPGERPLKVQFIFTCNDDASAYVLQNFDFSFCKVYTNLETLHCHNYFHQACKLGYIDNPKDLRRLIPRLKKYWKRGFGLIPYMH